MDTAHRLFHADSRHLLAQAARPGRDLRRELPVVLASRMLRAARQDWSCQRKLPAERDTPQSVPGSTTEHAGARPKVNGSLPGRTRHVCAWYITISSTGPSSCPHARFAATARQRALPARTRRCPLR